MASIARLIVVDSSVWIDFFAGGGRSAAVALEQALARQMDIAVCPVILAEVLQGFRGDAGSESARRLLVQLRVLDLDVEGYVEAARLFRRLRRRGVTVRGTIDCIIAQTCIVAGAELLTNDRDFAAIARYAPLRVRSPVAG